MNYVYVVFPKILGGLKCTVTLPSPSLSPGEIVA